MAKRFFYVCLGLLCLISAYQLGAGAARGEWNGSASGKIIGGLHDIWYDTGGEAWQVTTAGWTRAAEWNLPVPAAEVKFFSSVGPGVLLITVDDIAWLRHPGLGLDVWISVGPFPGDPVPAYSDSWAKIKSRYCE
jgi:hypothetical protein